MLKLTKTILATLGLALSGAPAFAADTATPPFHVFPDSVNLSTSRDHQSLVVQVVRPDGVTLDVTDKAAFVPSDAKLAKVDGHVVRPLADGAGTINVTYDGKTVNVPLAVKDAAV